MTTALLQYSVVVSDNCDCQKGQLGSPAIGDMCCSGSIPTQLRWAKKIAQLDECYYIEINIYIYRTKLVHIQKDTWRIEGILPLHRGGLRRLNGCAMGH